MFSKHLSLFFILSQITHVFCAGGSTPSASSNTPITLPLTLIVHGRSHENPTKLDRAVWSKGNTALVEGTTFSDGLPGEMAFLCAIKTPTNKSKPHSIGKQENPNDQYCSYHIKFQPKETLQCVNDAEPFAEKLNMNLPPDPPKDFPCGPANRGVMHWFIYQICLTKTDIENGKILRSDFSFFKKNPITHRSEFIVYRFCYDEQVDEVIYTLHQIKSPGLLEDHNMKNEREKEYEMITDGYHIFDSKFETMKTKYFEMINSSNEEQSTTSSKSTKPSYKIQKLVLPEDFSFAHGKKTAYHFLNTKLMREELVPLWDHINKLIRQDAIKRQRKYYLYTGTFNKSKNQEKITPKGTFQAPDIWLKLIQYAYFTNTASYEALVIMLDNSFDDTRENVLFRTECHENVCQDAFMKLFPEVGQYVRCCKVTKNIISYFDSNLLVYDDLKPDFLYDELSN